MENSNPLVRLVAYGKVKKMMKQFQGQKTVDNLERNLMRGMFRRNLKDFAELQQQEDVPLFERLKMKQESEDEARAKDEFRRMVVTRPLKPAKKMYSDEVRESDYGLDANGKGDAIKQKNLSSLMSGGIAKPPDADD